VDKYAADPLCGFVCTDGLYRDITAGLMWIHAAETLAAIPKELPIYLFAGDADPVGARPGTWRKLVARYRALGIRDVTEKLYAGGRHEMLNETNRDEVVGDVIAWLVAHLPRGGVA
jgi:alpha-beta hydrolase superfamily lysophospholipase